ncbi:MAG: hypothetical protein PHG35_02195 [Dehalococcoidales bacterium]|nr:hypothetical protein [Dehalococcoidales bacterium]
MLFKPDVLKGKLHAIEQYGEAVTRRLINIDHLGWLKCDDAPYCFIHKDTGEHHTFKPRYQVGETVYAKEAWRIGAWDEDSARVCIDYELDNFCRKEWLDWPGDYDDFNRIWIECSDDAQKAGFKTDEYDKYHWKPGESPCRWRSPLHLRAIHARTFFEVTDVRPERFVLANLTFEEWQKEGGHAAAELLYACDGKWVWRCALKEAKGKD